VGSRTPSTKASAGLQPPDNTLRASVVADPHFARKNTKDNSPAVIFTELVAGNKVDITVAAKGGGSENKSKLAMLNPGDSIVDWVLKTVPTMGRAGARRACWASASAARPRRRCCWPRKA
jgi:tartrate dehydratase alpha subunit/fumarate hydratase class I-like protein